MKTEFTITKTVQTKGEIERAKGSVASSVGYASERGGGGQWQLPVGYTGRTLLNVAMEFENSGDAHKAAEFIREMFEGKTA